MSDDASRASRDAFLGRSRPSRLKRYGLWLLVAVGAVALALLLGKGRGARPISYQTAEVKQGSLTTAVTATGQLAPTNQIQVGSQISGIVARVLVDVNDRVAKGQPIAVVDTAQLDDAVARSRAALGASEASVAQARATLAESGAQLARLREVHQLSNGRVPSQTEMATAVANNERSAAALKLAQANVVFARAQLSSDRTQQAKAVIRSPVAGVVLTRQIDPGQTVAASFSTPTLFVIAEDLATMKLKVSIDEADVGRVKAGQDATFTVDAYPGRTFTARMARVDLGAKSAGGATGGSPAASVVAYAAELSVRNADLQLRPGMTGTATITTDKATDVLLVPNAALRFALDGDANDPGKSGLPGGAGPPRGADAGSEPGRSAGSATRQVYVLGSDGRPQAVDIVTGLSDGRNTAATSAKLKPGMHVLTGKTAPAPDG